MDELRSFFNSGSTGVTKLKGGLTGGLRITKEDSTYDMNRREEHRHSVVMSGTDYAREAKRKETEAYMTRNDPWDSVPGGLDSLENFSTYSSMQNIGLKEEAMTEIYKKYTFQMKEDTKSLSIFEYKQQILDNIKAYPVVIIEGPTGCGKTTQVPQWILDECYNNRKPCKIIVTQPRRIAAISIAKRVAQERGWDVGGVVGYQVGLENRTTTDTRIHYVTTGVLLQKLVAAKNMNEYTHIILDEVHERGQEMDFLLLVTKKLLNTVSSSVRVILMSATIEQKAFTDYFSIGHDHAFRLHGMSTMSATVKIVKKDPMFTVKKFYLNHLHKFGSMVTPATPSDIPGIAPEMHHLVVKLLNAFELIDKQEDNYADRSEADLPSVLIFLPGINEIEDLFDALNDLALRRKLTDAQNPTYKWWVLPLHSTITADEQVRVFQRAPPGSRKIILATNIAESSITVPDIKYVIDYCLMKQLVVDENTNFTSLQLSWASKTNCEQRAGRAGRVRDGRVYRLVNDTFYENLKQECTPEIIRCPLERLVLLAKMLDMGAPSEVLALAMDPPDLSNIHRTVLVLKEVGALKKFLDDEWSSLDGDITYLGRVMAKLPLDVRVSKLIMLGYIYGVLDEAVIMAAAMTVKSIFSSPFRERLHAYNSKLTWADGSTSDCIAFYNVYKVWNHLRRQQYFKQQGNNEAQWARRFYVQVRALRELDDMVREIRMRLSREGIDAHNGPCVWSKSELPLVLKVIIAGAFYPQYFVQVSQDEHREFNAIKTLAGLDPRNTVYLKNFPDDQPGDIYATAIKNAVIQHTSEEPRVTFDTNSKKVFLTFSDESQGSKHGDPTIPGQVVLPVYKAIKARQLRIDIRIPLLPLEKALALSNVLKTSRLNIDLDRLVPRLPEIDDTYFPLKFTESVENLSKFWVRYDDVSTESELRQIFNVLNNTPLVAHTGDVFAGDMYAAPYSEGKITSMYRALVLKVLPRDMVELRYVDYGTFGRVSTSSLRILPAPAVTTPPLCMSCRLAGVQPAPLPEPRALWAPRAAGLVKHRAQGKLIAKVYSVVHGVVSIELLTADGNININDELIERGLAVRCEESYDSKLNHDLRMSAQDLSLVQKRAHNREQKELAFFHLKEMDPPNARECDADVTLKGPFSPLESTLHNLMYASREKEVQIEWNSVNSVLLDTEPQELYERLVVAGQVGQNDTGSKLTLRHTTLMPNIPGLPAIIALLFCPVAELRRDSGRSRYVSALCGLGSTEAGAPYFPEHDLLVDIDAELSVDDIGLINHLRHLMDYMMYCEDGLDTPARNDQFAPSVPKYIKDDFNNLLMKRRKHLEPQSVVNAWEWKSVPEEEVLEITNPEMMERSVIYPLHSPQELHPISADTIMHLQRETDKLKQLVQRATLPSSNELVCKLCSTAPMPAHAMRIHLYSNAHRERESEFRTF